MAPGNPAAAFTGAAKVGVTTEPPEGSKFSLPTGRYCGNYHRIHVRIGATHVICQPADLKWQIGIAQGNPKWQIVKTDEGYMC